MRKFYGFFVAIAMACLCVCISPRMSAAEDPLDFDDLRVLLEVLKHLQNESVFSPTNTDMRQFFQCMLSRAFLSYNVSRGTTLEKDFVLKSCFEKDQRAKYYTPQETEIIDEDATGKFIGVGIRFERSEDGTGAEVVYLLPGGPAARSGFLEVGDVIIEAGNSEETREPVHRLSLLDVVSLMRGERGTNVHLKVMRNDRMLPPVVITRDVVKFKAFDVHEIAPEILYIKIHSFVKAGMAANVLVSVQTFPRVRGFIIDLRGNFGGLVTEALDFLSRFFSPRAMEVLLVMKYRGHMQPWHARAHQKGEYADFVSQTVVLVDYDSASASEIAAGLM